MEEHNITWCEKTKTKVVKRYKVELLEDNDQSDEAVEIDGKKYKLTEI
jgi:hypothetical protein